MSLGDKMLPNMKYSNAVWTHIAIGKHWNKFREKREELWTWTYGGLNTSARTWG